MKKITMTDLNSLEETHNEATIEAMKSHVESVKAELVASARRLFQRFSGCECPDGTYKKNCC